MLKNNKSTHKASLALHFIILTELPTWIQQALCGEKIG